MPGYLEYAALIHARDALCVFVDPEPTALHRPVVGDSDELDLQLMDEYRLQRCCQMMGLRTSLRYAFVLELMCDVPV